MNTDRLRDYPYPSVLDYRDPRSIITRNWHPGRARLGPFGTALGMGGTISLSGGEELPPVDPNGMPGFTDKYRALLESLQQQAAVQKARLGLDLLAPQPHAQPLPYGGGGGLFGGGPQGRPVPFGPGPQPPQGPSYYTGPTSFQPLSSGRYAIQDRTPAGVPNPSQVTPEIQRVFDEVQARWPGVSNLGTYNVRNVAGTSTPSYHSYGDAIDLGGPPEMLQEIATFATRRARQLGISQIIYNHSIWTTGEGWHPYSGVNPHTDHVHITGPLNYGDTTPNYQTIDWNPPPKRRSNRTPGARTLANTERQRL